MPNYIPEIGNFALAMSLAVSLVMGSLPFVGFKTKQAALMQVAHIGVRLQFALLSVAMIILAYSFSQDDFSIRYVATHSNSALPMIYKISAIWGGHEGSLLLWVYLLSLWSMLVSLFSKNLPFDLRAIALAVLALVSVGFLLFLILTSNPFDRLLPMATEGKDLNPLLQDPGLAVHPPMLYMGYVGFAVPFAFVIAALVRGNLDAVWIRWSRPWTAVAWGFLTVGIGLGSYWAYYELGWGGWWFWDPVENASFMPWLMGTALLHSLAVVEKRGSFKSWVALLAIFTFSFSLLGTFLVRSGVLVSVHAFATDPERGLFILIFLALVILLSLFLYAFRVQQIHETGHFSLVSRETILLLNNVLLVSATITVLVGTLYPLVLDALDLGKLSVGRPYFNKSFVPIILLVASLIGFGVASRWKDDKFKRLFNFYRLLLPAGFVLGAIFPWLIFGRTSFGISLASGIAFWVIAASLREPLGSAGHKSWIDKLYKLPRHRWGMLLAHIGIGIFIIGATFVTHFSVDKDVRMSIGSIVTIGGYRFEMQNVGEKAGPNYQSTFANISVHKNDSEIARLYPEKRIYNASRMPMTEVAINGNLWRDLYVAMGDPLENNTWAMRVHYKPYVRFIWLGVLLMALGGFIAASSKRYRIRVTKHDTHRDKKAL